MAQNVGETKEIKTNGAWRIPIEAIIDLKSKNLANSQIAKLLNCNPSNITRRLQDVELTKQYVNHRPTVFAHIQRIILNSITDADIKKANLRDKIVSAGILYDKERLETGQSTQNIAYADALKARDQAKAIGNLLNEVWDQRQSEISQSATTAGLRAEDTKELCQLL